MKTVRRIVMSGLLFTLFFALVSCGGGVGFTPGDVLYEPRHAEGFTIYEAGEISRAIRITDPWQGASGVEQWVFLSRDGESPPEGFYGAVLDGIPRRIICMSSSYTAFLGEMGASDRIVGVSGAEFLSDQTLVARWRAGDIADVGYEANLDFERVAALRPDLVLMYGVRSGDGEGGGSITGKLGEMGVPYVFVGEYLEPSPLGRAEWIVALGEMLGLTEVARERFSTIEETYNGLAGRAADFTERPEVMFNAPYRDVWYVPGDDNYMVRLVRDAGGEYVCRGVGGHDSRPVDIEQAYVAMQGAEVWINTNHYATMGALLADNPRFSTTPPVRSGRVYNNNARVTPGGGSDFWESGAVRPDLILADLVRILHPEAVVDSTLYYYKRLE